jgi:hypothetical protein
MEMITVTAAEFQRYFGRYHCRGARGAGRNSPAERVGGKRMRKETPIHTWHRDTLNH